MLSWILEEPCLGGVQAFMEFLLSQPLRKGRDNGLSLLSHRRGQWLVRSGGESLCWEGKFGDDNLWPGALAPPRKALEGALAEFLDMICPDQWRVVKIMGLHGGSDCSTQPVPNIPLCLCISCSAWNVFLYPPSWQTTLLSNLEGPAQILLSLSYYRDRAHHIHTTVFMHWDCHLSHAFLEATINQTFRKIHLPCKLAAGRAPNKNRGSRENEGVWEWTNGSVHGDSPPW